jgi:transcriptional regulator with XRE-family HTH domain
VTDRRRRIAEALRAARKQKGWSQPRLLAQMRHVASRQGKTLAKDESMRLMTRWENAEAEPDEFHSQLLSCAPALGFDDPPPAVGLAPGEHDHAELTWPVRPPIRPAARTRPGSCCGRGGGFAPRQPTWSSCGRWWALVPADTEVRVVVRVVMEPTCNAWCR